MERTDIFSTRFNLNRGTWYFARKYRSRRALDGPDLVRIEENEEEKLVFEVESILLHYTHAFDAYNRSFEAYAYNPSFEAYVYNCSFAAHTLQHTSVSGKTIHYWCMGSE